MSSGLDKAAFESLFKEYFTYLCSFARKYVDDTDECKDIVHNVFVSLWQKRNEVDTGVTLKPYLFKSVHNRCLNHIRDNKKIVHHDLPQDQKSLEMYMESSDHLEQTELELKIKNAVDNLPDRCREVFLMSRFEDRKYAEIAEKLGVTVKAVEAQMTKALKILRAELIDYLPAMWFLMEMMVRVLME